MEDNAIFELDPELIAGFVDEAEEGLATLDSLYVKLEAEPGNLETINSIFRPVHTIKGNSAFFGLMKVKQLAHEMETLLTLAKEEKLVPSQSFISILLAGTDALREMLARTRNGQSEIDDEQRYNELIQQVISTRDTKEDIPVLWDELFDHCAKVKAQLVTVDASYAGQLDALIEIAKQLKVGKSTDGSPNEDQIQSKPSDPKTESKSEPETTAKPTQTVKDANKTMRVAEESIDNFLDYVGDLIVIGEMYNYLQKIVSESDSNVALTNDFKRTNETFNNLSNKLQQSIMNIRKVPVRTILQKAPRMIRDIAIASGKQVDVQLHGKDVEVDKRLIEILDGPLTHMVRNAVDHGIEMPDERQVAGKPPQGTICITATETADNVDLTITDDGKGLNLDAIKAKAIKLGLIKPEQELQQEQIVDLLFASGVSTAKEVTEVSGRGVGMDVVKRNVDSANGKIIINTHPGQGSEFIIRLPKTVSTQIIEGFLVRLAENCYVIPMDKVHEVFRPASHEVSTITDRSECVLRHDELLSVIRLANVLGRSVSDDQIEAGGIMVSINVGDKIIALSVDEVIGVQKVVLKELKGLQLALDLYSAAAVMGDGTVAMVLDIDSLARTATGR